jgi:hypothetical protein
MDQWWKRHKVDMGGYKRSDVEDITGCIPLLLDKCVVDGKIDLTVTDLRNIYNKAVDFVQGIRANKTADSIEWKWYVRPSTLRTLLTFQVSRLRNGLLLS